MRVDQRAAPPLLHIREQHGLHQGRFARAGLPHQVHVHHAFLERQLDLVGDAHVGVGTQQQRLPGGLFGHPAHQFRRHGAAALCVGLQPGQSIAQILREAKGACGLVTVDHVAQPGHPDRRQAAAPGFLGQRCQVPAGGGFLILLRKDHVVAAHLDERGFGVNGVHRLTDGSGNRQPGRLQQGSGQLFGAGHGDGHVEGRVLQAEHLIHEPVAYHHRAVLLDALHVGRRVGAVALAGRDLAVERALLFCGQAHWRDHNREHQGLRAEQDHAQQPLQLPRVRQEGMNEVERLVFHLRFTLGCPEAQLAHRADGIQVYQLFSPPDLGQGCTLPVERAPERFKFRFGSQHLPNVIRVSGAQLDQQLLCLLLSQPLRVRFAERRAMAEDAGFHAAGGEGGAVLARNVTDGIANGRAQLVQRVDEIDLARQRVQQLRLQAGVQ